MLRIATSAPGTTPPFESLTVPCNVPVTVCAATIAGKKTSDATKAKVRSKTRGPDFESNMGPPNHLNRVKFSLDSLKLLKCGLLCCLGQAHIPDHEAQRRGAIPSTGHSPALNRRSQL